MGLGFCNFALYSLNMAKKSSKSNPKSSVSNLPLAFGALCLFFSFFLFFAFISHPFSWRHDSSIVTQFQWGLLWSDTEVNNLMGRLGAILSNSFIFWGFGIASFFIPFLLLKLGIILLNRKSPAPFLSRIASTVLAMFALAVIFDFFSFGSEYPFGGNIGRMINEWMTNFLGMLGMVLLMAVLAITAVVLNSRINLNEVNLPNIQNGLKEYLGFLFQPFREEMDKVPSSTESTVRTQKPIIKEEEEDDSFDDVSVAIDRPVVPRPIPDFIRPKPVVKSDELEIIHSVPNPEAEDPEEDKMKAMEGDHFGLETLFDPKLDLQSYKHPELVLFRDYDDNQVTTDDEELKRNKDQIVEKLLNFRIEIDKITAIVGPTVTLFEIIPAAGVRISKIKNLEDDIALSLSALGIRIIAPIPGKGTIGIEVPNRVKKIVALKAMLNSAKFQRSSMNLPIALGKTVLNEDFVADLTKMPHLLIAGATGQGKSVGINAILMSLLVKMHPAELKLVLIDPKKVELYPYSGIKRHFMAMTPNQNEPIITDTSRVLKTLKSLVIEMEGRYDLLKQANARNLDEYNTKFKRRRLNPDNGHRFLPYIVLVIDEFADLIMTAGKEIEHSIQRLAQLARAVGIHLVIATQRPSVNIITGIIKANFPARIAFKVASKIDSRTILDAGGADQLIGQGDCLLSINGEIVRLQAPYVDTAEVEEVIKFINNQQGYSEPYILPEDEEDLEDNSGSFSLDELDSHFEEAAKLTISTQVGSTSNIQRNLKLGFNRAGRIMDQLYKMNIVGPPDGSKARQVLFSSIEELEQYLKDIGFRK
jgi:DNA segregation ATPase FtsK/SpoIIIE, S-DNA-T family